jgi:hypothetical protein
LVTGDDTIGLEDSNIVPADCINLELLVLKEELLVDLQMILGGEEQLQSISTTTTTTTTSDGHHHNHHHNHNHNNHMATRYMGAR